MKLIQKPIPTTNYSKGRGGNKVEQIVIHWIVGTLKSADATFANPARLASAHYGVGQTEIHQYVQEVDTAWHASNFSVNQRSIGIEHEGGPTIPITDAVYKNSAELIASLWKKYGKVPLYPHNKFKATQCPGTLDLKRLEKEAMAFYAPDPCATIKAELATAKATIAEKDKMIKSLSERLAIAENKPAKTIIKEITKTVEVEPSWLVKLRENINKFFGG